MQRSDTPVCAISFYGPEIADSFAMSAEQHRTHSVRMTAPDAAALEMLPAIALALRQGDQSAFKSAALQLKDLVTNAPAHAAAALYSFIVKNGDVVDAAFVQALGRCELSEECQHALVLTMMTLYMKVYDDCNDPSSPMMQASPFFLPILLSIMAREHPVSACR